MRCAFGHGPSCLALAYSFGGDPKKEQEETRFYRRACVLGVAVGCTNYGAILWKKESSEARLPCVLRMFEKACAAKEPWGCGMVGRAMLERTTQPSVVQARKQLEASCDDVGGFPCRVLAKHVEAGTFGEHQPEQVHALLARACETGDSGACGEPATAAETFRN